MVFSKFKRVYIRRSTGNPECIPDAKLDLHQRNTRPEEILFLLAIVLGKIVLDGMFKFFETPTKKDVLEKSQDYCLAWRRVMRASRKHKSLLLI